MLLSCCGGIEFAAHLGESLVDMVAEVAEILAEVDEVLAKRVETCRCGLAEIAEFTAEFADVAVGGSREHPSRCGVLFTGLYSPGQVAHLAFECSDAWFEIRGVHDG
ncbi:hypothetical protein BMG05_25865 [Mycobacterium malmoense]|nr:hypothetical protein BMG05_25865 [Mycobacterium malmoense]